MLKNVTMKKFVHAAAFALVGWFLMVPPQVCPNPTSVFDQVPCGHDLNAPLNKWLSQGYFDSPNDCEDRLRTMKRSFPPGTPSMLDEYQCVYEGDPRLTK
jgi:hypothetical protein